MQINLELEESCWKCDGAGKTYDKRWAKEDGTCEGCAGNGTVPTQFGQQVLDLVRRHIKPECLNAKT